MGDARSRTTRRHWTTLLCIAAVLSLSGPAVAATVERPLARELEAASPGRQLTAIATVARSGDHRTASRLRAAGLDVIRFKRLPLLALRGTAEELRAAARVRGVRRLSANAPIVPALAQTRAAIGASAVHEELGVTGKGVNVAVVDSGVDGEHPDLAPAMVENVTLAAEPDVWSEFGVSRPGQVPDAGMLVGPSDRDASSGHGTHVAGTIAGSGQMSGGRNRGIAPGAGLVGVGAGKSRSMLFGLLGLEYVLEHHERLDIEVVNNSWGASPAFVSYDPDNPVNVATKALHAAGVAVVFAAGNDGPDAESLNAFAPWPWVFSVANGCVDGKPGSHSLCRLAEDSSRGKPGDALQHPDVTAPGTAVVSARAFVPDPLSGFENELQGTCGQADPLADFRWYTCNGGTSMAAPHVAGTMALLEDAAGCDLAPDQLYALLTDTATPMPGFAEWEVGAGFLAARAAVEQVLATRRKLCKRKRGTAAKATRGARPRARW